MFRGVIYQTRFGNESRAVFNEDDEHIVDGLDADTNLDFLFWSAITQNDGKPHTGSIQNEVVTS